MLRTAAQRRFWGAVLAAASVGGLAVLLVHPYPSPLWILGLIVTFTIGYAGASDRRPDGP